MKTLCGHLPVIMPRSAIGLVFLFLALRCSMASADTWDIQTVDFEGDVGQFTSLALDTLGFPHISYHDVTNENLKYAFLDEEGWHIQTVDSLGHVEIWGSLTSLALDTQ